jgi:hypothetical protein
VASVPLTLSEQASEDEWKGAIAASLAMLEAALERQSEAASKIPSRAWSFPVHGAMADC